MKLFYNFIQSDKVTNSLKGANKLSLISVTQRDHTKWKSEWQSTQYSAPDCFLVRGRIAL